MTVVELLRHLEEAIERGLPGETSVVVHTEDWYHEVTTVEDPTNSDCDMWFTINLGQPADARFTAGGLPG